MQRAIQQTYRHFVQQRIVQWEMSRGLYPQRSARTLRDIWETGGIAALIAAAAVCGLLAQAHLGA